MKTPRVLLKAWNIIKRDDENLTSSYNGLKTIATEHERIHAGKAWYSTGFGNHLSASPTRFTLIKVDSGAEFHVRDFGVRTNQGPYSGTLYEAPVVDVSSLGVVMPFPNLDRNSSNIAPITLYANPSLDVNSLGTFLDTGHIFEAAGGAVKQIAGEISTLVTEWSLKPDTYYAAVFVNSSGNNADYVQHLFGFDPRD